LGVWGKRNTNGDCGGGGRLEDLFRIRTTEFPEGVREPGTTGTEWEVKELGGTLKGRTWGGARTIVLVGRSWEKTSG